jgi:hypothetical protein
MTNLFTVLTQNMEIHEGEMRGKVAQILLENIDKPSELNNYIDDVMQYGCISGCVSGMIYYYETVAFYDEYREFIEDIFMEYGFDDHLETMDKVKYCDLDEGMEEIYDIDADIEKNRMAWTAFELVTSDLYSEYESEMAV